MQTKAIGLSKYVVHTVSMYNCILRRSSHQRHISEEDAARQMDIERGNLSMDKYMKALKQHDPNVKKRKFPDPGI